MARLSIIAFAAAPVILAQQPAPSFEVASIKPHKTSVTEVRASVSGTLYTVTAYGLEGLILDAYQVDPIRIVGLADWMRMDLYDIAARAPAGTVLAGETTRVLLRNLLADRFQLKVHREERMMPVFKLVAARGGPKMKASTADAYTMSRTGDGHFEQLSARRASMSQLADLLSRSGLGRAVLDATELTGVYDISLKRAEDASGADTSGIPLISTAIEEQLGLRLVAGRSMSHVLVIDHASHPSPN